jgi:hypothetical protein
VHRHIFYHIFSVFAIPFAQKYREFEKNRSILSDIRRLPFKIGQHHNLQKIAKKFNFFSKNY